jgi:predicted phage terminase large subunit-like protein
LVLGGQAAAGPRHDTASKGGPDNVWSVCTTWIVTRKKHWYLIDVWR